jgi:polysaccharide biosynthesis protein PslH
VHLLWLKTELLHPLDKGGRIRTYEMLRQLLRHHRITYLTLDDGNRAPDAIERAAEYCTDLVRVSTRTSAKGSMRFYAELLRNLFSPLPYAVAKYRSAAMERTIEQLVERDTPDLLVCDFLAPSVNVPDDLPVASVLFQHNVEATIWQRHAAVAKGRWRRAYLGRQWQRMHAYERAQCRRFSHVVAVSAEDAAAFASDYGTSAVSHVPTGVDTEYFRPSGQAARAPREIIFTGSMDWMPNEDAVRYFIADILPIIHAQQPDVSFTIVGRNPSPSIWSLADRHPQVRVTGTVPDVRPFLERAAVIVVPLRVGGGTRLKLFEAMAMEKAIVTTTVGAEGLPVRDDEHLLIADSPDAFAAAVLTVLRDPASGDGLGQRAAALVRSRFGWSRAAEQFADSCRQALAEVAPAPSNEQTMVNML